MSPPPPQLQPQRQTDQPGLVDPQRRRFSANLSALPVLPGYGWPPEPSSAGPADRAGRRLSGRWPPSGVAAPAVMGAVPPAAAAAQVLSCGLRILAGARPWLAVLLDPCDVSFDRLTLRWVSFPNISHGADMAAAFHGDTCTACSSRSRARDRRTVARVCNLRLGLCRPASPALGCTQEDSWWRITSPREDQAAAPLPVGSGRVDAEAGTGLEQARAEALSVMRRSVRRRSSGAGSDWCQRQLWALRGKAHTEPHALCQSPVVRVIMLRRRHQKETDVILCPKTACLSLPSSNLYPANAGGHGTNGGSGSDDGSRDSVPHGRDAHAHGPSLPVRAPRPAAAPVDAQRGRHPLIEQAGISTAEARLLLEQLAADPPAALAGVSTAEARTLLQQLAANLRAHRAATAAAQRPQPGSPAVPPATLQRDRQPVAAQPGINTAEARLWLQQLAAPAGAHTGIGAAGERLFLRQLAAGLGVNRAGPAAARQPQPVDPAAGPPRWAADPAAAVPQPEPAGALARADDGPLAAVRQLLVAILSDAQRHAALCAAFGRTALVMILDLMIGWSRAFVSDEALQVRGRCLTNPNTNPNPGSNPNPNPNPNPQFVAANLAGAHIHDVRRSTCMSLRASLSGGSVVMNSRECNSSTEAPGRGHVILRAALNVLLGLTC